MREYTIPHLTHKPPTFKPITAPRSMARFKVAYLSKSERVYFA